MGRRGDRDDGSGKRMPFLGDIILPSGCFELFIHYLGFSCPMYCQIFYINNLKVPRCQGQVQMHRWGT